jgi:hypothetical protein
MAATVKLTSICGTPYARLAIINVKGDESVWAGPGLPTLPNSEARPMPTAHAAHYSLVGHVTIGLAAVTSGGADMT